MSGRKISPVEINGKTIWIEVDDIEVAQPPQSTSNHPSDLRGSAAPVGPVGDFFKEKIASIADTLEAIVGTVDKGIEKISPDEWSVELTIGFAGEHNIPFVATGSVNGGIKINAKWKKANPTPQSSASGS